MASTWPHLFLLVCKTKNAKNGTLIKHSVQDHYILESLYICYQCHQRNILRMSIRPYSLPVFVSDQKKKKKKKKSQKWYLCQINFDLLVCLFVCLLACLVITSRQLGPKGSNFQDLMGATLGSL